MSVAVRCVGVFQNKHPVNFGIGYEQMLEMTTNYMLEIEADLKKKQNELEEAYKQIRSGLK